MRVMYTTRALYDSPNRCVIRHHRAWVHNLNSQWQQWVWKCVCCRDGYHSVQKHPDFNNSMMKLVRGCSHRGTLSRARVSLYLRHLLLMPTTRGVQARPKQTTAAPVGLACDRIQRLSTKDKHRDKTSTSTKNCYGWSTLNRSIAGKQW